MADEPKQGAHGKYCSPSIGDANGNEILKGFHIETMSPDHKSDLISAPIELGEKRFDNKVLQPISVSVTGYIQAEDYDSTIKEILRMWENRKYEFYTVLTRNGEPYHNMCLQNCPMKETPEKFDLVYCTLNFQQVIITAKTEKVPAKSSDKSTSHQGAKGAR